ncbi:MAG TPA: hypothetical protein VFE78_20415 [Gemmataceae bacterium]|jgi:hypothetical protein|nr:hypothetical protein [Gemmataceae bacterium]
MATTYTSTIEINVWKEHTCVGCGGAFRYLFKRKKSGSGGSPAAAQANARKAVANALAHEVDLQPCPGCGLYQPDMIGTARARRHWWVFAATLVLLLTLLILALTEVLAYSTAAWVAAAGAAAVLLVHLLIDANNPNRDLEANLRLAQSRVEAGDLWVPRAANPNPGEAEAFAGSGWSPANTVACALLGLAVLAFLLPEALRMVRGWPQNRQWFPVVAGPGDEVYTYFPDKITSVKGYWSGQPTARVENWQELGLASPTLGASSKSDNWGGTIRIGSKESKTSTNTVWVKVKLPPGATLEGKTLKLKMDLAVRYPELQKQGGKDSYQDAGTSFSHSANVRLGSAKAGERYRSWWWGGMLTGAALLVVASVLVARLASALRQKALPTEIFVPGQGEGQAGEEGIQAPPEAAPPPPRPDDHVRE